MTRTIPVLLMTNSKYRSWLGKQSRSNVRSWDQKKQQLWRLLIDFHFFRYLMTSEKSVLLQQCCTADIFYNTWIKKKYLGIKCLFWIIRPDAFNYPLLLESTQGNIAHNVNLHKGKRTAIKLKILQQINYIFPD